MSELFVKLPHAVIDHADLDLHEFAVYIVLLRFRNPKTGKCFPGMSTIADAARMSTKTASRTIKKLEERGLINVDRVKTAGSKTNESNGYKVHLMTGDPLKYAGASAKGGRVPKRDLSDESRERMREAASRSRDSESLLISTDSQSLPCGTSASSRDSESVRRDSESHGVGTPSPTKKIKIKKNHEEDITPAFGESTFDHISFDSTSNKATEKQVQYLKDLSIHLTYEAGYKTIPTEEHLNRWRKLTTTEADNLIQNYKKELGRPDDRYYPEHGTPQYEALSKAGQEFADTGGLPDSVFEYSSAAQFMKENSA